MNPRVLGGGGKLLTDQVGVESGSLASPHHFTASHNQSQTHTAAFLIFFLQRLFAERGAAWRAAWGV